MRKIATALITLAVLSWQTLGSQQDKDFDFDLANRFNTNELVDKVKSTTSSWVPYDVGANPFRDKSDDELAALMGLRDLHHPGLFQHHSARARQHGNLVVEEVR